MSALIARIKGINPQKIFDYQQAVLDNNINGMVLSQCELDELGKCLGMKFGDWQLFRAAIEALREAEENPAGDAVDGNLELTPTITKPRSGSSASESASRVVNFSDTDLIVPESESEELDKLKNRGVFRRQSSVDTQKGNDKAFEVITEEEDTEEISESGPIKPPIRSMKRNDSMVAEAIYESGLLRDFVQNFTENVSEEEEEDLETALIEDEETLPNGDILNLIQQSQSQQDVREKPPVQFSLSMDHIRRPDNDNQSAHIDESPDTEPLLASGQKSPMDSPVPILKLPGEKSFGSKSPDLGRKGLTANTSSEPDLTRHEAEAEVYGFQELRPLLPSEKSMSTSSTGFSDIQGHQSMKSGDSFEFLSMVDETKSHDEYSRSMSLEESIEHYTRQKSGSRSGSNLGESPLSKSGSPGSQLITSKDSLDDSKTASFV